MLVADCASEALTTEDELRRERSGVQCEAQASLSALRRELPPALHLHLLRFLTRDLYLRSLTYIVGRGSREPPVHSQRVPDSRPER